MISRRALLASALAIGCYDAPDRTDTATQSPAPERDLAELKSLTDRYSHSPENERGSDACIKLRRQISDLYGKLIKDNLPLGSSKEKVIRHLGPPEIDWGDAVMYAGDDRNWFHCLSFKDGKLIKINHEYMHDIEGGR